MNQSINLSINQSINEPINQSNNQSINASINECIHPSINQSINRVINAGQFLTNHLLVSAAATAQRAPSATHFLHHPREHSRERTDVQFAGVPQEQVPQHDGPTSIERPRPALHPQEIVHQL